MTIDLKEKVACFRLLIQKPNSYPQFLGDFDSFEDRIILIIHNLLLILKAAVSISATFEHYMLSETQIFENYPFGRLQFLKTRISEDLHFCVINF